MTQKQTLAAQHRDPNFGRSFRIASGALLRISYETSL